MPRVKKTSGTRRGPVIARSARRKTKSYGLSRIFGGGILRRSLAVAVLAMLLLWAGAWLMMSGAPARFAARTQDAFYMSSARRGFAIGNILLEGRENADPDVLLGLIGANRGDPIFAFDPSAARTSLEKESWIESARVERRLPGVIYVSIRERTPFALWQNQGKVRLIDARGVSITDAARDVARFRDLPLVVGDGAAGAASGLLTLMRAEPDLMARVDAASYVGGRRWDLKLKNNVVVRLPEGDLALALRRLADAQEKDALLDKDLDCIDLREASRMIIRTRQGEEGQDYQVSYKAADKAI